MNVNVIGEDKALRPIGVRCPQCCVTVEVSGEDVMVYCVRCRRWCRALSHDLRATAPLPSQSRRGSRCH